MRKILWILVPALMFAGLGFGLTRLNQRELTTSSQAAFDLYQQGNAHLTAFQFDAAVQDLEKALDLDPRFAMAAAALAQGYGSLGRGADRDSLVLTADRLAALLNDPTERMLVQLRLGNLGNKTWASARDSLHAALLESAPENIILLTSLAAEAKRRQDTDAAERYFRKILDYNPNYAAAYNELGYIEFYRGNYDRAIELLQRYTFLAPDIANPFDSLGEVYTELGRYEDAESQLLQAISLQADYMPSLLNLVRVYLAQGQMQKGTSLIAGIAAKVAGTPFEREVRDFEIGAYYNNQLWAQLERATAEFIALYPENSRSILYRGMRLAVSDRPDLAEAVVDSFLGCWKAQAGYMEKPASKRSIDALEHEFRALICQNRRQYEQAALLWGRALDLAGNSRRPHEMVFLHEQYGTCLLAAGRPAEALDQAVVIFKLNPANGAALSTAAEASLAMDNIPDAELFVSRLEMSLLKADQDFPLLAKARELRARLSSLAGS